MIEGDLPNRAQEMLKEWVGMYKDDFLEMWKTQIFKKVPGLKELKERLHRDYNDAIKK